MKQKVPQIKAKTVFIDVDTTISDPKVAGQNTIYPIAHALMKKFSISAEEAQARVEEAEANVTDMVGRYWPFGILEQLGLSGDDLWNELVASAESRLFMHPDARLFLKALKNFPGIRTFPASTNPRLVILSKLAIGGLADENGSPYLDGCFGGEEVSVGGKCGAQFYEALLKRTHSNSDNTLMVGDDPETDLAYATEAGIRQVVLVRRGQSQDWTYGSDGALYVKSLEFITGFFPN